MSKEWRNHTQWLDPTGEAAVARVSICEGRKPRCSNDKGKPESLIQQDVDQRIAFLKQKLAVIRSGALVDGTVSYPKLAAELWKLRKQRRKMSKRK